MEDLTVFNDELIAAGWFLMPDEVTRAGIASWDGISWEVLGGGVNDRARVLATYKGDLYVGGDFLVAGGIRAPHLVRWDGSTWHAVNERLNWSVSAFAEYNGHLVLGGDSNRGDGFNGLVSWDGDRIWLSLGKGVDGTVFDLQVFNGDLYAGGNFRFADGLHVNGIARWNGSLWQPLRNAYEEPDEAIVYTLEEYERSHFVGGAIFRVGGRPSVSLARWGPTASLGDFDDDADIDLLDLKNLLVRARGPRRPADAPITPPECLCTFNADGDRGVDLLDFSTFQNDFLP